MIWLRWSFVFKDATSESALAAWMKDRNAGFSRADCVLILNNAGADPSSASGKP